MLRLAKRTDRESVHAQTVSTRVSEISRFSLIAPQDRSANDIERCLCAALSVLIRSSNQLKLELYRLLRQPVSASRQPRIRDQRTSDITSETGTAVQLAIGEAVPSTVNSSRTFPGVFLHTTVSD